MANIDHTGIDLTKRVRVRSEAEYEIPFDDSAPEEFTNAAKVWVDSRLAEKHWDQFIENLTDELVYDGDLRHHLDEDTMDLGADWVIAMVMRRFGYEFVGVPQEYKVEQVVPGTVSVKQDGGR